MALRLISGIGLGLVFFSASSSTNFTLKGYDFGSGGGSSSSTNFSINGTTNGQSGQLSTSANYSTTPGLVQIQNSNVPPAPNFSNPDSSYNRLKLIINTGNNPSDTKFAIAISSDNFATTKYVKSDNSLGNNLSLSDYQNYTSWGGASGVWVTGLQSNTTYKVKVKSMQGKYSETAYGPTASATTVQPAISFAVTTSLTSTPPFPAAFSSLAPGSVYSANADPIIDLTTNSLMGGKVYISDSNSGLKSSTTGYTINSASDNLATANIGYGAQVISQTQVSGGPFAALAPFDGAGNNVGSLSNITQPLLTSPGPVSTGNATVRLKAKTDITVPSSSDYGDVITFIASMSF